MVDALKGDKARTTVGTISQFGLLELSRQRIDMELSLGLRTRCPTCNGTGNIPTVNAGANAVLRKIRTLAATGKYTEVNGELPLELANHLLNHKRESLRDLEMEFDIQVHLFGDPDLPPGHAVQLTGKGAQAGAAGEDGEDEPATERAAPEAGGAAAADDEGGQSRRRRRRRGRGRGNGRAEGELVAADSQDAQAESAESPEEQLELIPEDDDTDTGGASEIGTRESRPERKPARRERPSRPRDDAAQPVAGNGGTHGSHREVFVSTHLVTRPEVPPLAADPGRRRDNPLKARAAGLDSGLVFDSNLGSAQPELPPPPPPSLEAPPTYSAGIGHRVEFVPRAEAEEAVAAEAMVEAGEAEAEPEEREAIEADSAAEAPAPDAGANGGSAPQPRPRRRRRGRSKRADQGAGEGRAAPVLPRADGPSEEHPDDNIGNVRKPEDDAITDEEDGPAPGNEKVPSSKRAPAARPRSARGGRGRPRRPRPAGHA
jgi:ribonuclease E